MTLTEQLTALRACPEATEGRTLHEVQVRLGIQAA